MGAECKTRGAMPYLNRVKRNIFKGMREMCKKNTLVRHIKPSSRIIPPFFEQQNQQNRVGALKKKKYKPSFSKKLYILVWEEPLVLLFCYSNFVPFNHNINILYSKYPQK